MSWHPEFLPPGCLQAAQRLSPVKSMEPFYLAGGTALALRYGHRKSVDLDFFSSLNTLQFREREALIAGISGAGARIEENTDGTVHALIDKTHVSFFRYRYALLRPTLTWQGLKVAHPVDIGLMKLGAVIGRGSRKDFIDLYFIAQRDCPLKSLLRRAHRKFPDAKDFALQAYRALVYFDDAEREPMPRLRKGPAWETIRRFFETQVREITSCWKS